MTEILDELSETVYIADTKTYELLFLNKAGQNFFSVNFDYRGRKCYQILQNRDFPCPFCTNSKLTQRNVYQWEFFNPIVKRHYLLKAKDQNKDQTYFLNQLNQKQLEKVLFPLMLLVLTIILLPPAAPLIGMLAFGNFVKESGAAARLSKTMENELMNIVSILLSLGVGSQMTPEKIIKGESLGIIVLGLVAFAVATAGGLLMAKLMNVFLPKGKKINPLIGSAGVSAVPMAARVAHKVAQSEDPSNFILMNAMGPNVAGVIGTAMAAGVFIATYGGLR